MARALADHAADAPVIVWFRHDLRLADNPALAAAAATGRPLIPVFVLDETSPDVRPMGGASRWWLDGGLRALASGVAATGAGALILRRGAAGPIVRALARQTGAAGVYWNRLYEAPLVTRDAALKAELKADGVQAESFKANLLFEPWEIATASGAPYRVFTPFWRACREAGLPADPAPAPSRLTPFAGTIDSDDLDTWDLTPTAPDWASGMRATWTPGENGAVARLTAFLEDALNGYANRRDTPGVAATSRLSPHLRWGEISPRTLVARARSAAIEQGCDADADKFLAEIGWREFSASLLFHNPDLATTNLQTKFDQFPWRGDPAELKAWRGGRTGYPIVDAGMRELWATGWMHNRVRMIAASFLIKHLMIDWREGEAWFWDTLVDADAANNAASWQWVAGSGADAAPYFRIFNPIAQGEKFDADGAYVRAWVPELARLPNARLHAPWTAEASVLTEAGVALGEDYPRPIVAHKAARERALAAFQSLSVAA